MFARAVTVFAASGSRLWSWALLAAVAVLVLTPLGALLYGAVRTHSPGSRRATFTLANLESVYGGLFGGGWTQSALLNSLLPMLYSPLVGVIGWNLFIEAVNQLRHDCGERQVKGAQIIQYGSFLGESIIFRR